MPQHAFGTLGSQPLSANGNAVQPLYPMDAGPVKFFMLRWNFSLKSTAGAFALNILTGQSAGDFGSDDVDILLDLLISTIKFQMDSETQNGIFAPSVWRRLLGYMNVRDFAGTFMAGGNVPASGGSAQEYDIVMVFPVSLETLFADGKIFANGSARMKTGRFEYKMGASLTPNAVLTHGTAAVTGLVENLGVFYGTGSDGDIGHAWQAEALDGLPNVYNLGPAMRIGLFDQLDPVNNPGRDVIVEDYVSIQPSELQAQFEYDRYPQGGYDVSQAMTPYVWVKQQETFLEYAARTAKVHKIQIPTGVSQLNLFDLYAQPPSPTLAARAALTVGGGGTTHSVPVVPDSLIGIRIPEGAASLVPLRVQPGAAPAGSPAHTAGTPSAAGARIGDLQSKHNSAKAAIQAKRGK